MALTGGEGTTRLDLQGIFDDAMGNFRVFATEAAARGYDYPIQQYWELQRHRILVHPDSLRIFSAVREGQYDTTFPNDGYRFVAVAPLWLSALPIFSFGHKRHEALACLEVHEADDTGHIVTTLLYITNEGTVLPTNPEENNFSFYPFTDEEGE